MRTFYITLLIVMLAGSLLADVDLQPIINISAGAGPASNEQDIGIDGSQLYLTWNNTGAVAFKRSSNDGTNWGNLATVYGGDELVYYPVVAATAGNVYIAYWHNTSQNQEIFFSRSVDDGSTFSAESQISTSIHQAQTPQIAARGDTIFVAYEDRDADWNYQIYLIRSYDAGDTWSSPVQISPGDAHSRWCNLVWSSGKLFVVYNEKTGADYDDLDLFFTTSDDYGTTWDTPVNITNNQAYNARLNTSIHDSTVYIVTSSKIDGIQDDIILYRSHDLGETWEPGINLSDNSGDSARPWIWVTGLSAENHRIYVVWTDDTYAGDDQSFLKYSMDHGTTWSDRVRVSQEGGNSAWAKIVGRTETTSDLLYIVWNNFTPGIGTEVYGRRAISLLGETGTITGTVTNTAGGFIPDAMVTVHNTSVTTDTNGRYSLDMVAGDYDVICTAPGYYTQTFENVTVPPNDTITVNFTLESQVAGLYPPFRFRGEKTAIDEVTLQWDRPLGFQPRLLSHDDGTAERFYWIGSATGSQHMAVGFTHDQNYNIRRLMIHLNSEQSDEHITLRILGDDSGLPDLDNALGGPYTISVGDSIDQPYWFSIDTDVPMAAGSRFYITSQWNNGNSYKVGTDESNADGFSYTTGDNGTTWYTYGNKDFMMRAGIAGGTDSTLVQLKPSPSLAPREPSGYYIYRNGLQLNGAPVNSMTYIDADVTLDSTYVYHATAVYPDGESGPSNPWEITMEPPLLFPPVNLQGKTVPGGINLTWEEPGSNGEWLHWDDGINDDAVGGSNISMFDVASRFEPQDLSLYNGNYLTKVSFYLGDANCEIALRIWEGGNQSYAGTLIREQNLEELTANLWHTVSLTTPVQIDASQELWIGYRVVNPNGVYPAGTDDGPAVPYKGDMLLYGSNWVSLYDYFGWNFNWNIQGYVVDTNGQFPADGEKNTIRISDQVLPPVPDGLPGRKQSGTGDSHPATRSSFTHFNIYRNFSLLTEVSAAAYSFTDTTMSSGEHNYYLTTAYDQFESSSSDTITMSWTGLTEPATIPPRTELLGNYPNPFNPETTIRIALASRMHVSVIIFDINGQRIRTLLDATRDAGRYQLLWDGTNDQAERVASGVYFYRFDVPSHTTTRPMVLLR